MKQRMFPFSYSDQVTPTGYHCSECGASGVKLWRDYQTFLCNLDLFCYRCALENQDKTEEQLLEHRTDQIGWLVPAVPTEEGDTFWGYSSVPEEGVKWWYRLPSDWSIKTRRSEP